MTGGSAPAHSLCRAADAGQHFAQLYVVVDTAVAGQGLGMTAPASAGVAGLLLAA